MSDFKYLPEKPEKNPFGVPEGYFDTLSDRILTNVNTNQEVKVIPLYSKFKYFILSSAAVLLLFLGILWVTNRNEIVNLNHDQIEYYLNYGQHLNTYDLVSLMEDDYSTKNDAHPTDIELYLIKNNDIEWLIEIDEQP
ncbi:MAG: hypothetical protein ACK4RM_09210 [Flavobacterium sp.]